MVGDKKNRALLVGTITYAIGSFGTKFLNFLIVPLYTYYILPSDLGDYDLLVTTVSLLSPLLTLKISEATYRWIINKEENEDTYISATFKLLLRNCVIAAVILAIINIFIPIWNCYYFIAILVGDRILECLQKLLRGVKNQKLFAASGIFHTAIMVGLNVLKICYFKEGVLALLQSSVISIYATIVLILICEKRLRRFSLFRDYRIQQKEMLKYSTPLVPSALSWWVINASDRYVIRFFSGSAANGIYSVSYKFPSCLQMIFNMFNNAWTDMALSELEKGEASETYAKEIFRQLYRFSFGAIFVLIPLTKVVMKVLLSSTYKEAAIYIGFLYIGTVFQGFSTFCNIGYLQSKKTGGAAKTSACGAAVNLIIDLIFIKFIGLFAAAISTFLGFFVMWIIRMKDIQGKFPVKINIVEFSLYLATGVTIAVITIWTNNIVDLLLTGIALIFFFVSNKKSIFGILSSLHRR